MLEKTTKTKNKGYVLAYTIILLFVSMLILTSIISTEVFRYQKQMKSKTEFEQRVLDEQDAIKFFIDVRNGTNFDALNYPGEKFNFGDRYVYIPIYKSVKITILLEGFCIERMEYLM